MTAPMPHPFQAHVPATPPPELPLFGKGPMSPDMSKTTTTTTTSQQEAFFNMFAAHAQQVREQQRQKQRQQDAQQQQQQPTPVSSRQSSSSAPVPQQPPPPPQTQTNLPFFGMKTTSPAVASGTDDPTQQPTTFPTLDPKSLAMASRIAAYYQQRCQAIANFQQQRCQQWANMQRAKCQEMMQATMLVVAWYIRDRIQRRRRKQKRVFKRGLEQRERQRLRGGGGGGGGGGGNGGKVTKGKVVRRWVLDVPIGILPPTSPAAAITTTTTATEKGKVVVPQPSPEVHDPLQDQAEAIFALGGGNGDELPETKTEDKDSQMFTIADNLIKSQLARIDVPLLGVLNLDESDSEESSEEDEEEYYEDEYEDDYEGEEYDEEEEEYEDEEGGEEENVVYECVYGNDQGPKMKVTAVPSLHQHQQQQQQQRTKVEDAVVMSPEGMGSEEVQLGTTESGSAGRKRGASEIS
ncbi:hypothetical protein B0H65DRAFT_59378 [Neurospora tetraspora]|uniref:Uncharacterized protein n=1 Tax=Neurospora tetraspora TaxID=94610 RepID=A0AAE0MWU5_9PEZI|nr:hypothetical protein B0H65DRAFT_59378 [Neurospora tetraspora]